MDEKQKPILESLQEKGLSLPDQVAGRIRRMIIERRLDTGDKLPTEQELMEQLNVGRGTVREAVKLLVARNVLEIRRGKGTFVCKHTGVTNDPLGFAYMQDQRQLAGELFEIRMLLEPWVASLAAQRATDEDLAEIRALALQVEELVDTGENFLAADELFHICIARCTQNRVLPKLLPAIAYSVHLFGNLNGTRLRKEAVQAHRKIVEEICRHDPEAACHAMQAHLEANRNSIFSDR